MTFAEAQQQIKDASALYQAEMEAELKALYAATAEKCADIRDRYYSKYCAQAKDGNEMFENLNAHGRLEKMQTEIQAEIDKSNDTAMGIIKDYSSRIMMSNYYAEQFVITAFAATAGPAPKFAMLDLNVIDYALEGQAESWNAMSRTLQDKMTQSAYYPREGTLSDLMAKQNFSAIANTQQVIASSFLSGMGTDAAARMIRDQFDRNEFNARRVAQTEMLFLSNCGDFAAYEYAAANGVAMMKQWMWMLSQNPRQTHRALDGKRIPVTAYFIAGGERGLMPHMFSSATNNSFCHCTTISVIKGLEDDLESIIDPVTGKDGNFSWANFNQWLTNNGLNPEEVNAYIFRDK